MAMALSRVRTSPAFSGYYSLMLPYLADANSPSHDFGMNAVVKIGNGKILTQIFSHLPMEDLLICRLVCSFWNKVVCTSARDPNLLWSKTRLEIRKPRTQKRFKPFTSANTPKLKTSSIEWQLWESVFWTPLISLYKCPNIHIHEMDLRRAAAMEFFIAYGKEIQRLEITNCELSLVTFQKIMSFCPNLTFLEITPVPYHSIIYCESLSLQTKAPTFGFKGLKTLILCSEYKKHFYASSTNGICAEFRNYNRKASSLVPDDVFSLDYLENQLQPSVIDEIIYACPLLQEIMMSGWTGDTMTSVLKSLSRHERQIKILELQDILLMFDPEDFEASMAALTALHLESFALTFLNPLSLYDILTCRLNSIVKQVLLKSSKTLVSLNLKNCSSVDESIFKMETGTEPNDFQSATATSPPGSTRFHKLEMLEVAGTNIRRLSKYVKFMPNLKTINFKATTPEHYELPRPREEASSATRIQDYDLNEVDLKFLKVSSFASLQNIRGLGVQLQSFVQEKLPTVGEKLTLLAQAMLLGVAVYCGYYPFFMERWSETHAFMCVISLSTALLLAYSIEKKLFACRSEAKMELETEQDEEELDKAL